MSIDVTVVIATHDRRAMLLELLRGLAEQTLAPDRFEVVVVDDGSRVPVRNEVEALMLPYERTVIEQANAGAASARHRGIEQARGGIIVILDDDMLPLPGLLEAHLDAHVRGHTLVLGHIMYDAAEVATQPIFERARAVLLRRLAEGFRTGREMPRGVHVCTGNVSFRRRAYFEVGGFDASLARSEDRDLGVRLEKAGAKLGFADAARSVHRNDVVDLAVWLRRSYLYGVYDLRIGRKNADVESADPWRYLFMIHPVSRVLVALTVAAPAIGAGLARAAMWASLMLDRAGAERAALAGTTLCYGLEYFRGMRAEAGSLGRVIADLDRYRSKRSCRAQARAEEGGT